MRGKSNIPTGLLTFTPTLHPPPSRGRRAVIGSSESLVWSLRPVFLTDPGGTHLSCNGIIKPHFSLDGRKREWG